MNKNQQNYAENFSSAICLGKEVLGQKPSEILYKKYDNIKCSVVIQQTIFQLNL